MLSTHFYRVLRIAARNQIFFSNSNQYFNHLCFLCGSINWCSCFMFGRYRKPTHCDYLLFNTAWNIFFFGVVFLDLVFRQVYLGRYLSNVEKETLAFIKVFLKCDLPSGIFCWETELQKEDHKFFATNRLRYYFFIGMFLIVPPLSVYIGITLLCQSIQTILQLHNIYLLIGLFTYISFAIFLVIYIIRILRL